MPVIAFLQAKNDCKTSWHEKSTLVDTCTVN